MKKYISKNFNTDRNRPIYFNDDGIPFYGPIEGNYVSAVEAGPIMEFPVIKEPQPVDTIVPRLNTSQNKSKSIYHDKDAVDFNVRKRLSKKTKKNKNKDKISKEKRKSSKEKHCKENAYQKQSEFFEEMDTNYEDYDDYDDYDYPDYESDFSYYSFNFGRYAIDNVDYYDFDDYEIDSYSEYY
jgi:hypothetical protein